MKDRRPQAKLTRIKLEERAGVSIYWDTSTKDTLLGVREGQEDDRHVLAEELHNIFMAREEARKLLTDHYKV